MISKHLKSVGLMPLERFVTTYSHNYKPFSECHLQVNQVKPRCEAAAAPAFINPSQTHRETWPTVLSYFYKTTNSIYGSFSLPQSVGLMPLERFVTTYSHDYKPFSECHLQVNQLNPRCEAAAAPAFINPPQSVGLIPLERFVTTYSHDYKPFSECHLQVNQVKPRCEAAAAPAFINPSQSVGLMPLERFVTTYSHDYKPFSECHLQVNQLNPRCEAAAAPAFINPPQTHRETWPTVLPYFYKTTNSIYGSFSLPQGSQPPMCSLFPGSLHPLGIPAPSTSEASAFVDTSLTEARIQKEGVAWEMGPLLGEENKGQLHYVFGGKANMLEQQEAKDEPQKKIDVLYEEGVIVLSSHVGPACCEDFQRSVCREAGLQHQLNLPVTSRPIITTRDAENHLISLEPAVGMKNITFLQPASVQCRSTIPLAHVQPIFYSIEPTSTLPLTEYQAQYTAEWAQLKMQQSDIDHRHLPRHHQILYHSL